MPIIATFRATVTPVSGLFTWTNDFNGDSVSDILWRNTRTGSNTIWKPGNRSTEQAVVGVTDQAWTMVGVGDFNGDGVSDILWRNTRTGANTRSEEHTSELQSLMRISYAVFCLKKKK